MELNLQLWTPPQLAPWSRAVFFLVIFVAAVGFFCTGVFEYLRPTHYESGPWVRGPRVPEEALVVVVLKVVRLASTTTMTTTTSQLQYYQSYYQLNEAHFFRMMCSILRASSSSRKGDRYCVVVVVWLLLFVVVCCCELLGVVVRCLVWVCCIPNYPAQVHTSRNLDANIDRLLDTQLACETCRENLKVFRTRLSHQLHQLDL